MKAEDSEWVSISDFMASIVAIIIIFLIALIAQQQLSQNKSQKIISDFLKDFSSTNSNGTYAGDLLKINPNDGTIEFDSTAFDLGNPCLTPRIYSILVSNKKRFKTFLEEHKNIIITIEGYADTSRVLKRTMKLCNFNTYFYGDNITLSLCRAQETRAVLTENWNDARLSERIAILGYGATKAAPGIKSLKDNRRVVFRIEASNSIGSILKQSAVKKMILIK